MPLKNNWQNGETFTPAAANDMADVVNASGPLPAAYFNAALLANGALPTTGSLNSGHPYVVTGDAGFTVASGAITTNANTGYVNFGPLRGHIREFSIEMLWTDGGYGGDAVIGRTTGNLSVADAGVIANDDNNETVVMIVADGPFANSYPTYANAGAHFLIHREYFSYQKRPAAGPGVTGKTYYYKTAMALGTKYTIRLLWDGVNAVVVMHDGTIVPIPYDADYATFWGLYGCVEILGSSSGKNKVSISSFNATSEVKPPDAPLPASRLLGAMQTSVVTSTSTAITTSLSAKLFGLSVPIPPSRRVLITGSVFMEQTVPVVKAASTLALGVYPAGVSGYGKLTTIYSGFTPANATADETLDANRAGNMTSYGNGILIPFSLDLVLDPAFAIGDIQDFQVKMQASAASQWSFIDSGGGTGFSGIRRSTMSIFEIPA
jgi:hypothetical protein